MKWEKQKIEEIDEMLEDLNKLKALAKDKLTSAQERLKVITDEIPNYVEIYKKMKGL
jgi:uncharacterized protein YgfB (UPF0149 family)